jgi:serine kinase of HPr protein (carbohydrate metabolism regulator)
VLELSRNSDANVGFRLGPNFQTETILGTGFAKLTIPVRSGRNLAVLVETAVKIYELWLQGKDASRDLVVNHTTSLSQK